ncbi:MAG: hypothetical protein ACLR8N_05260 [Lachnospiraceae bacterium]|nr:hypothetical protein C6W64_013110 [Blautia sp. SG-772]
MATILNQAKETLKTCREVKKEAENMYVYKNDKRAMQDITTAENVRDAASEAMGKIELTMSGLKKTKKNNEKYVTEYKNMKEIRDEAKNNCRRIPINN